MRTFHVLLASFVLVIVLMAGLLASTLTLSLSSGFERYLDATDERMFDMLATGFQERLNAIAANGVESAEEQRAILLAEYEALRPRRPGGRPPSDGARTRPPPPPPPPPQFEEAAFGLDPREFGSLVPRIMVFAPDGTQLAGPPAIPNGPGQRGKSPRNFRELTEGGEMVMSIRLLRRPPLLQGTEDAYLRTRYRMIAVSTLGVIALGVILALFSARYIAGWLNGIRGGLASIAARDFDISPPRGLTAEQHEIAAGLHATASALRASDDRLRRWFAELGHELRTPITILRGEIDALIDGIRPVDKTALASLQEEVSRLSYLVEDLHVLSLSDLGAAALNRETIDARAEIVKIGERWQGQARAKGLELALPEAGAAAPARLDVHKIDRVVDNLLSNSVRYTDAPGRIRLSLAHDEQTLRIVVEDSAPGVPADELEQILEPLRRFAGGRDRINGGSGLGLAIVNAVVTAHGGSVTAEPSGLGGLRIVVVLPRDAE